MQIIWPTFVLPRWEATPDCEGHLSSENITILEPPQSCEELIANGDMEEGISYWYHRNDRSDIGRGALVVT